MDLFTIFSFCQGGDRRRRSPFDGWESPVRPMRFPRAPLGREMRLIGGWLGRCLVLTVLAVLAGPAMAGELPSDQSANIDAVATEWLAETGAPSVSIAIVLDGKLAYAGAYGRARLEPSIPAMTETRYAIASVSKEFTAATILLLQQDGKLSLNDPAGRWFPGLGDASGVTVRQLLSHTAGLRDYWPQDFVPPAMLERTTTPALLDRWARQKLDYPPGTDWQYSNTGYVLAGAIAEKSSGQRLFDVMQARIFGPLGMDRVTEDDTGPLPPGDAGAYTRYGLGPVHSAPKEGAGWLFGAAGLAMRPTDLARWDISLLERSLLAPESYAALFEPTRLADGSTKPYGLGLDIETVQGRARIGHDGEASGFLAANRIWPDDRAAIVVLTNNDWASPDDLVDRLAFLVLPPRPEEARARAVFAGFQAGTVDRSLFTDAGNAYLEPRVLADLKTSLGPLGPPRLMELERQSLRGGMVNRRWKIRCGNARLEVVERGYPDGKLEQFLPMALHD